MQTPFSCDTICRMKADNHAHRRRKASCRMEEEKHVRAIHALIQKGCLSMTNAFVLEMKSAGD